MRVVGREHREKHLRLPQDLLNLLPPVVDAGDLVRVEEDPEPAPGERAEGEFDVASDRGDLPALIVAAGVIE